MLRRLARRLLGRRASPPSPPPRPRPAPAPAPEEPEEPLLEIEGEGVRAWVEDGRRPLLLDIREPHELRGGYARGAMLLPMNRVPESLALLPRDRPLVVVCAAGARSFGVAHYLREQGFEDAWSLAGGVGAWFEAGGELARAPADAALPPLTPARLRPEAAAARGLPEGLAGTVQDVEEGPRYTLGVPLPEGGWRRVEGLTEAELEPVARTPRRPAG